MALQPPTSSELTPAHSIFSILEILEQIISHLPPLEIIRCQRVNKTFQTLITSSPLLQYKAWLRNDHPDPTQHPKESDYIPDFHWEMWTGDILDREGRDEFQKQYEKHQFYTNINRHLHPIIAAKVFELAPEDPRYGFDPLYDKDQGWGGYLDYKPKLIRALQAWYEKYQHTEHIWGKISLYRPAAKKINWQITTSGGAGLNQRFEAKRCVEGAEEGYESDYMHNDILVKKRGVGEPYLTVSDILGRLDESWEKWIESEHDEHYFSHDGQGCDWDEGVPPMSCYLWEDEEEEDDDEDDEDDEEGGESERQRLEDPGENLTREEREERARRYMEDAILASMEACD